MPVYVGVCISHEFQIETLKGCTRWACTRYLDKIRVYKMRVRPVRPHLHKREQQLSLWWHWQWPRVLPLPIRPLLASLSLSPLCVCVRVCVCVCVWTGMYFFVIYVCVGDWYADGRGKRKLLAGLGAGQLRHALTQLRHALTPATHQPFL